MPTVKRKTLSPKLQMQIAERERSLPATPAYVHLVSFREGGYQLRTIPHESYETFKDVLTEHAVVIN